MLLPMFVSNTTYARDTPGRLPGASPAVGSTIQFDIRRIAPDRRTTASSSAQLQGTPGLFGRSPVKEAQVEVQI